MQNKPNFLKIPIYASSFTKTTYENFCAFGQRKNKAKQSQFQSPANTLRMMAKNSF